jgi:hypothetical protein
MRFALYCYCVLALCAAYGFAQIESSEEPSLGDVARHTREQKRLKSADISQREAQPVQEPGTNIGAQKSNTYIEPSEVLLPLGVSQPFQLLDAHGDELPSDEGWTVSDPTMAELKVEGGHAVVLARRVGSVTLRHESGAETGEIRIHDRKPPMPVEARWILQSIDGVFVKALWASGTWFGRIDGSDEEKEEESAAYFYEDRGSQSSHIRAIREDGLQAWQWPAETQEVPHMLCGDFYSGVLVWVGDKQNRMLISITASGKERWRVPVPGFPGRSVNVGLTGDVLLAEESPDSAGARVVVLNGRTGTEKLNFALPPSREIVRNMEFRNGNVMCLPGAESSRNLPAYYSDIMTNAIVSPNVTTLAYSEISVVADASTCERGAIIPLNRIHLTGVQRLVMWDMTDELITKFSTIEEHPIEGDAASLLFEVAEPAGDIIVGETGTGNFLAVRQARRRWPTLGYENVGYFQYRVTEDRTVKYRFPVKVSSSKLRSTMLLGDDNAIGYVTRGNSLVAFDTDTAKEAWRWKSDNTDIDACAALKGDAVLVREGRAFSVIRSGKLEDHRNVDFMLFVMKFLPNSDP